jgi:hypothetical protein
MVQRKEFPRPVMRRDVEIAEIEQRIWRDIQRYMAIAAPERITFFMNNLRSTLTIGGHWLPRKEGK